MAKRKDGTLEVNNGRQEELQAVLETEPGEEKPAGAAKKKPAASKAKKPAAKQASAGDDKTEAVTDDGAAQADGSQEKQPEKKPASTRKKTAAGKKTGAAAKKTTAAKTGAKKSAAAAETKNAEEAAAQSDVSKTAVQEAAQPVDETLPEAAQDAAEAVVEQALPPELPEPSEGGDAPAQDDAVTVMDDAQDDRMDTQLADFEVLPFALADASGDGGQDDFLEQMVGAAAQDDAAEEPAQTFAAVAVDAEGEPEAEFAPPAAAPVQEKSEKPGKKSLFARLRSWLSAEEDEQPEAVPVMAQAEEPQLFSDVPQESAETHEAPKQDDLLMLEPDDEADPDEIVVDDSVLTVLPELPQEEAFIDEEILQDAQTDAAAESSDAFDASEKAYAEQPELTAQSGDLAPKEEMADAQGIAQDAMAIEEQGEPQSDAPEIPVQLQESATEQAEVEQAEPERAEQASEGLPELEGIEISEDAQDLVLTEDSAQSEESESGKETEIVEIEDAHAETEISAQADMLSELSEAADVQEADSAAAAEAAAAETTAAEAAAAETTAAPTAQAPKKSFFASVGESLRKALAPKTQPEQPTEQELQAEAMSTVDILPGVDMQESAPQADAAVDTTEQLAPIQPEEQADTAVQPEVTAQAESMQESDDASEDTLAVIVDDDDSDSIEIVAEQDAAPEQEAAPEALDVEGESAEEAVVVESAEQEAEPEQETAQTAEQTEESATAEQELRKAQEAPQEHVEEPQPALTAAQRRRERKKKKAEQRAAEKERLALREQAEQAWEQGAPTDALPQQSAEGLSETQQREAEITAGLAIAAQEEDGEQAQQAALEIEAAADVQTDEAAQEPREPAWADEIDIDAAAQGEDETEEHDAQEEERPRHRITVFKVFVSFTAVATFMMSLFVVLLFTMSDNTLLKPKNEVDLPNFYGMKVEDVSKNAAYAGFTIEYEDVYSEESPKGTIIDQRPKAPRQVKENAKITLRVSAGIHSVELPDVINMARDEAKYLLRDAGLNVLFKDAGDEKAKIDTVLKTEPKAGTVLEAGETVTLYVNNERMAQQGTQAKVPNCIGLSTAEAGQQLGNRSLSVGAIRQVSSGEPAGTVLGQSPSAGTIQPLGTSVTLTVSAGPQKAEPSAPSGGSTGNAAGVAEDGHQHVFSVQQMPPANGAPAFSIHTCTICGFYTLGF